MINNIPNVPREMLEELRDAANESMNATTRQHQIDHFAGLIAKVDALLSAPSPAGVDADHIEDVRAMVKAQGVVMPERWNVPRPMWKDARQPYGNPLNHADIEAAEKFNLALDEVARLNAAPVQQVSVPDGWRVERGYSPSGYVLHSPSGSMIRVCDSGGGGIETAFALFLKAMLAAAPAAPAADAWIPVGDRLPEVESRLDQECRAGTLSIAPLNVSAAVLVFDGEKVRSTRLEWFDGCLPLPYCITHWMPLPAAPAAHSSKGVV